MQVDMFLSLQKHTAKSITCNVRYIVDACFRDVSLEYNKTISKISKLDILPSGGVMLSYINKWNMFLHIDGACRYPIIR